MNIPTQINKMEEVYNQSTCLYSKEAVEAALDRMAREINSELAHKNPVLLCVMISGLIPTSSLLLRLDFPLELDYVHATRYKGDIRGTELQWKQRPQTNLQGRVVLVVDDILDGGLTLSAILEACHQQGAKEVYSAVLVDKQCAREAGGLSKANFTGLEVDDHYVFGYGMDYRGYWRNVPGIFKVAPQHE